MKVLALWVLLIFFVAHWVAGCIAITRGQPLDSFDVVMTVASGLATLILLVALNESDKEAP